MPNKRYTIFVERFYRTVFFIHKKLFKGHYRQLTELLTPNIFGIEKIKLGRPGDGTYVLPSALIKNEGYLLSFGIADDISFEEDFSKRFPAATVFAFDPSINQLPFTEQPIHFTNEGIAGSASKRKKLITIPMVIKNNHIDIKKQIIIKMDVEGWEWGVLKDLDSEAYNIPVMALEFHMMLANTKSDLIFFPYFFWRRVAILKKLLNSYYIYHLHVNNYKYTFFKDFTFPWVFELTLIKKSCFTNEIKKDTEMFNEPSFHQNQDIQFPFFKNQL